MYSGRENESSVIHFQDISMREKIIKTLHHASDGLKTIDDNLYIIGSSALILSGIDVGETADIDILTTSANSNKLQYLWKDKMEAVPKMKEDDLFTSNFARFNFPLMDIEVMGDLKIWKGDSWLAVSVNEYTTLTFGQLSVRIPTIEEQLRILYLFDREKDRKRIELIKSLY